MIRFDNNSVSNQILTGTKLPTYRQRFTDGQEESVQYRCCQDYQGTECASYAPCNIFCVFDYLYLLLLLLSPLVVCLQARIIVSYGSKMQRACTECFSAMIRALS